LELRPEDLSYITVSDSIPGSDHILHSALQTVDATTGSLIVLDDHGHISAACLLYDGQISTMLASQVMDTIMDGLAGWVVKNRRAALVKNTCEDPRWLRRSWDDGDCSSRSAISMPVISTGRVAGVMTLVGNSENKFTEKDLFELASIAV
jgi:hypothetical protein